MSNKDGKMIDLGGLTVPVVTPLTKERKFDEVGMRNLVSFLLEKGVDGIFVAGTTGEFATLPRQVRRKSLKAVLKEVGGRASVFYGISSSSSSMAVAEAEAIEGTGTDALVSTPPFYYGYSQQEIFRHFELVAESVDLPIFVYDIPSKTQNRVEIDTLNELFKIENIVGLKDTTGDMKRFQVLAEEIKGQRSISLAQGTEEYFYHSLLSGADGLVSGIANLWPSKVKEQLDAIESAEYEKARKIQADLFDVFEIYDQASFLAGIKTGLSLKGICEPYLTEPFRSPDNSEKAKIRRVLSRKNVI